MDWTVLTLGRFSRNRYWGEDESRAHRSAVCTSTLIRAPGCNILVDPSLPGPEMAIALDGGTGLKLTDINIVYITHAHGDHFIGLDMFTNARILIPAGEFDAVASALPKGSAHLGHNTTQGEFDAIASALPDLTARLEPAGAEIAPSVAVLPLPGHTLGLAGLLFDSRDGVVAVAGDAVMTRDFFDDRHGYFNSVNQELSAQSINTLAGAADVVVPGHGNYFLTHRKPT